MTSIHVRRHADPLWEAVCDEHGLIITDATRPSASFEAFMHKKDVHAGDARIVYPTGGCSKCEDR